MVSTQTAVQQYKHLWLIPAQQARLFYSVDGGIHYIRHYWKRYEICFQTTLHGDRNIILRLGGTKLSDSVI